MITDSEELSSEILTPYKLSEIVEKEKHDLDEHLNSLLKKLIDCELQFKASKNLNVTQIDINSLYEEGKSTWIIKEKDYTEKATGEKGCKFRFVKNAKEAHLDEDKLKEWFNKFLVHNENVINIYPSILIPKGSLKNFILNHILFTVFDQNLDLTGNENDKNVYIIEETTFLSEQVNEAKLKFLRTLFRTMFSNYLSVISFYDSLDANVYIFFQTMIDILGRKLSIYGNFEDQEFILRHLLRIPRGSLDPYLVDCLNIKLNAEYEKDQSLKNIHLLNFVLLLKIVASYKELWDPKLNNFQSTRDMVFEDPNGLAIPENIDLITLLKESEMIMIIKKFNFEKWTQILLDFNNFEFLSDESNVTNIEKALKIIKLISLCLHFLSDIGRNFSFNGYSKFLKYILDKGCNILTILGDFMDNFHDVYITDGTTTPCKEVKDMWEKIKSEYNSLTVRFTIEATNYLPAESWCALRMDFASRLSISSLVNIFDHFCLQIKVTDQCAHRHEFHTIIAKLLSKLSLISSNEHKDFICKVFKKMLHVLVDNKDILTLTSLSKEFHASIKAHKYVIFYLIEYLMQNPPLINPESIKFFEFVLCEEWTPSLSEVCKIVDWQGREELLSQSFQLTMLLISKIFIVNPNTTFIFFGNLVVHQSLAIYLCNLYFKNTNARLKDKENQKEYYDINLWIWEVIINLKLDNVYWNNKIDILESWESLDTNQNNLGFIISTLKKGNHPYLSDCVYITEIKNLAATPSPLSSYIFISLTEEYVLKMPYDKSNKECKKFLGLYIDQVKIVKKSKIGIFPYIKCFGKLIRMLLISNEISFEDIPKKLTKKILKIIKKYPAEVASYITDMFNYTFLADVKQKSLRVWILIILDFLYKAKDNICFVLNLISKSAIKNNLMEELFIEVFSKWLKDVEDTNKNTEKIFSTNKDDFSKNVYENISNPANFYLNYIIKKIELQSKSFKQITLPLKSSYECKTTEIQNLCFWFSYVINLPNDSPILMLSWLHYMKLYYNVPYEYRIKINHDWNIENYLITADQISQTLKELINKLKSADKNAVVTFYELCIESLSKETDPSNCALAIENETNFILKANLIFKNYKKQSDIEFYYDKEALPKSVILTSTSGKDEKVVDEDSSEIQTIFTHPQLIQLLDGNKNMNSSEYLKNLFINYLMKIILRPVDFDIDTKIIEESDKFFESIMKSLFNTNKSLVDCINQITLSRSVLEDLIQHHYTNKECVDTYICKTIEKKVQEPVLKSGDGYGTNSLKVKECKEPGCNCLTNITLKYTSLVETEKVKDKFFKSCKEVNDRYAFVENLVTQPGFISDLCGLEGTMYYFKIILNDEKWGKYSDLIKKCLNKIFLKFLKHYWGIRMELCVVYEKMYLYMIDLLGQMYLKKDNEGILCYDICQLMALEGPEIFQLALPYLSPPLNKIAINSFNILLSSLKPFYLDFKNNSSYRFSAYKKALMKFSIIEWSSFLSDDLKEDVRVFNDNILLAIKDIYYNEPFSFAKENLLELFLQSFIHLQIAYKNSKCETNFLMEKNIQFIFEISDKKSTEKLHYDLILRNIDYQQYEKLNEINMRGAYKKVVGIGKSRNIIDIIDSSCAISVSKWIIAYLIKKRVDGESLLAIYSRNYENMMEIQEFLYNKIYGISFSSLYESEQKTIHEILYEFFEPWIFFPSDISSLPWEPANENIASNIVNRYISHINTVIDSLDQKNIDNLPFFNHLFESIINILTDNKFVENPYLLDLLSKAFCDIHWKLFKTNEDQLENLYKISLNIKLLNFVLHVCAKVEWDQLLSEDENAVNMGKYYTKLFLIFTRIVYSGKYSDDEMLKILSTKLDAFRECSLSIESLQMIHEFMNIFNAKSANFFLSFKVEHAWYLMIEKSIKCEKSDENISSEYLLKFQQSFSIIDKLMSHLVEDEYKSGDICDSISEVYGEKFESFECEFLKYVESEDSKMSSIKSILLGFVMIVYGLSTKLTLAKSIYSKLISCVKKLRNQKLCVTMWNSLVGSVGSIILTEEKWMGILLTELVISAINSDTSLSRSTWSSLVSMFNVQNIEILVSEPEKKTSISTFPLLLSIVIEAARKSYADEILEKESVDQFMNCCNTWIEKLEHPSNEEHEYQYLLLMKNFISLLIYDVCKSNNQNVQIFFNFLKIFRNHNGVKTTYSSLTKNYKMSNSSFCLIICNIVESCPALKNQEYKNIYKLYNTAGVKKIFHASKEKQYNDFYVAVISTKYEIKGLDFDSNNILLNAIFDLSNQLLYTKYLFFDKKAVK